MFTRPLFVRLLRARLVLAVLGFTVAPAIYADCPMQTTRIVGSVQSNDQPVAGALVKINWDEQRGRNLSAEARSGVDGKFELTLSVDSFNGRTLLAREKCGYQPDQLELEVRHEAYRDFNKTYTLDKLGTFLSIQLRSR